MAEQKIYPKGISFFQPRENAPTWVKGSIIITPNELFKWLKENESLLTENEKYGKQLRLQVTDKGVQVDTWKPNSEPKPRNEPNDESQGLPF